MTTDETQDLLDVALADYEIALESGDPIAVEQVLSRYPQARQQLREHAALREAIEELARPLRGAVACANDLPQIARYQVAEVVETGGMGVIYRAFYEGLNKEVALKVMRHDRFATAPDIQRFHREAEFASQLGHRNIVSVHDIGQENGRPYYSMRLVNGPSLKRRLEEQGVFEPAQALNLMIEIAEALAAVHQQGIVHRDLKPGNILIDADGYPRIIDFGVARRLSDPAEPEGFVGTLGYASPEQADLRSHEAGPPADVFSLGLILYEMLTGVRPLAGANLEETRRKTLHPPQVSPQVHRPEIPADLANVCMKCLREDPAERYRDAGELAADLLRVQRGENPVARASYPFAIDNIFRQFYDHHFTQMAPQFLIFLLINSACLAGVQGLLLAGWGEPLVWVLLVASCLPVFTLLRSDENRSIWPTNPAERTLWAIWVGVVLAEVLLCLGLRLANPDFVAAFHLAYAIIPIITGLGYFVMAAGFSLQNSYWGLGWMVWGVLVLTCVPQPWSVTAFVIFDALCCTCRAIEQYLARHQKQ